MRRLYYRNPAFSLFKSVTIWLIGINLLVFFFTSLFSSNSLYLNLGLSRYGLSLGRPWVIVTHMFVHGNIQHILFNMLGLFFFGIQVERRMGVKEFLAFYFVTGVLSGLTALLIYFIAGTDVLLIGASGAVFAVAFGFAMYFADSTVLFMGRIPMRGLYIVFIYAGIEILSQIFGTRAGVAHLAHLAGFAFAFLYFLVRLKINPIDIFKRGRNRTLH